MHEGPAPQRRHSLPVTRDEIAKAMEKYAHLVPASAEQTILINDTLRKAITDIRLTANPDMLKNLVVLICSPDFNYFYATYAYMVFATALHKYHSEVNRKLEGMLATISHAKSGGGGAHPNLYWAWYGKGYFDKHLPAEHDE